MLAFNSSFKRQILHNFNSAFSLSQNHYLTDCISYDQKEHWNAPCHEEGFQGTGVKQDQVGPESAVHWALRNICHNCHHGEIGFGSPQLKLLCCVVTCLSWKKALTWHNINVIGFKIRLLLTTSVIGSSVIFQKTIFLITKNYRFQDQVTSHHKCDWCASPSSEWHSPPPCWAFPPSLATSLLSSSGDKDEFI